MRFSRPLPVRPALPARHASQLVATRAAFAVTKASASQAVATHAALLHRSRAVPLPAEMKHGEPATYDALSAMTHPRSRLEPLHFDVYLQVRGR
jgi:hypothetical protein